MLAQFAARLRARQGAGGGGGDLGGGVVVGDDGETVILDDNCTVSFSPTAAPPKSIPSPCCESYATASLMSD